MAFCGKCGAPLSQATGFCGGCGAAISMPQQQTANPTAWSPVSNQQPQSSGLNSEQELPATPPSSSGSAQGWNSVPGVSPSANWTPSSTSSSASPVPAVTAGGTGLTPNLAGALAYSLGIITGILFLVLEPYRRDRFVRFHAMQSIVYFVAALAFSIAWRIMVGVLMSISGWIALASMPIRLVISLAMFCLWLFLMFQAYNGREFSIPILGGIARKQADARA